MASTAIWNLIQRRKKLAWLAALGIAVLLTVGMFVRNGSRNARYLTAEVRQGNITATVQATGTINPLTTVPVGSYVSGGVTYCLSEFNTLFPSCPATSYSSFTKNTGLRSRPRSNISEEPRWCGCLAWTTS